MPPQRWERIKMLFEQAQECPAGERPAFLSAARGNDEEMRVEIERMLASESACGDFLERAPFRLPHLISPAGVEQHRLRPGDVLCGRFKIQELLGRGGMGEVYAAYDSELEEFVALKTIRAEFADDDQRIGLLRREVQQARRIVHPGVCRVYDLFT